MKPDFDMIVIGGGAAGLTAAGMSAVLGAKTALVSDAPLGGDCTWHGCIPSKALLKSAKVAHQMRHASKYGLTGAEPIHDWAAIAGRVHAIRNRIFQDADAPPNMEKLGVEVIPARARFISSRAVEIAGSAGKQTLTSWYFTIAAGSRPMIPAISGIERLPVLTNETLFELQARPGKLLVLGAGPVGIEMAQAFQRLGSNVTVVSRGHRILERDDPDLTTLLECRLREEGIRFHLGAEVARFEAAAAYLKTGEPIGFDRVLVAAGRIPNIEALNLSAAQVAAATAGILVDNHCRTNVKNIFACGDVTGRHLFTHMAEHTAKVAVMNAILHVPSRVDERRIPWCTFTDPELAHVGSGEHELRARGESFQVYRFPFSRLDRAIADSEDTGLVKVCASKRGRIFGASILGATAGDAIAEFGLAMKAGVRLGAVSSAIHAYPTYALGNRRA